MSVNHHNHQHHRKRKWIQLAPVQEEEEEELEDDPVQEEIRQANLDWLEKPVSEQGPLHCDFLDMINFKTTTPFPAITTRNILQALLQRKLKRIHSRRQQLHDLHDWIYRVRYYRCWMQSFKEIAQQNLLILDLLQDKLCMKEKPTRRMNAPLPLHNVLAELPDFFKHFSKHAIRPTEFQNDMENCCLTLTWKMNKRLYEHNLEFSMPVQLGSFSKSEMVLGARAIIPTFSLWNHEWILDPSMCEISVVPEEENTHFQTQHQTFSIGKHCNFYFVSDYLYFTQANVQVEFPIQNWLVIVQRLASLFPIVKSVLSPCFLRLVWSYVTCLDFF